MTAAMRPLRMVVAILVAVFAWSTLTTAEERDPRWLLDHGRARQARSILEQRVRDHPQDAEAWTLLARTMLSFVDYDAAITAAEKAVALNARRPTDIGCLRNRSGLPRGAPTCSNNLVWGDATAARPTRRWR